MIEFPPMLTQRIHQLWQLAIRRHPFELRGFERAGGEGKRVRHRQPLAAHAHNAQALYNCDPASDVAPLLPRSFSAQPKPVFPVVDPDVVDQEQPSRG